MTYQHGNTKIHGAASLAVVALLGVMIAFSSSPAHAQAVGATDIDITLPDIVILHYFSNVDVEITDTELGNFLVGSPGDSEFDEGTAAPAAGDLSPDLNITPTALTGDPSAALLTLRNAWAVRAISLAAGTQTRVSIANTDATLDHTATTATITITGVAVDDGATNGASVTFTTPGLVNPQVGGVELTLDLTNADNAGVYADGVYTLTATNI